MAGGEPVIRMPEQAGDVSIGTAAQSVTNHSGIAAGEAFGFIKDYLWADDQRREQRQHEFDLFQRMTSDRLEKIAEAMETMTHDIAETRRLGQEARRWLIGLTLALVVVGAVVVAVVADRLGVIGLALLVATAAARIGR